MKRNDTGRIAYAGITAALYVVLTLLSYAFGLSGGAVQLRLSEALCVLPCFLPEAVPGLFAGCVTANLLTGCALPDVLLGSLATLIGAWGTLRMRGHRVLCLLPPVAVNTVIVPLLLRFVYGVSLPLWQSALYVLAGESLSCFLGGQLMYRPFQKMLRKIHKFS